MKEHHSIATLCAALAVSRAGYYHWKSAPPGMRECEDSHLIQTIHKAHAESHGSYGSPRITRKLRKEGRHHGRKRIARLMRQEGLSGRVRRRFVPKTTQSNHDEPIAPNRLAEAAPPTAANQMWTSDITYVQTGEGWLYVAAVLDLWSRKIVGWAVGDSLAADLVIRALDQALTRRTPPAGLLYHSDRGVQYACRDFRQVLSAARLVPSMSRKGNCYDNATMESFWSSYKTEWVYAQPEYATRADATAAAFSYIEVFYNRERLHSSLGYQSPVDFENQNN